MRRSERGVALITVLLVTSLALLIVGAMLRSHRLALNSAAQHVHHVQLRQLALSAEAWALERLRSLPNDPKAIVALGQAWAIGQPEHDPDNGHIRVRIEDMAGRFNLTRLLSIGPVDPILGQRWQRLQTHLELAPLDASVLRGLSLSDISQLRQVPGVDAQWLRRMQPWIVLLPKEAQLNINTAPATVLATLEGVTPALAKRLAAQRPSHGYATVEDFTFTPLLIGLGVNNAGLATHSRWFRIHTQVQWGRSRLHLESDLERDLKTGRWHILQRRLSAPLHSEPAP